MAPRTMGDSTTFTDIPMGVSIVAYYVSGHLGVVTPAEVEARFPNSKYGHVSIDVNGSRPDADVRDWETGDKSGSLEQWVIDHNKSAGRKSAVVYCNRSTIAEVRQLTGSQILNKDYWLWVTTLDGTKFTGVGVIACQDKGESLTGGHWDESVVYDNSFWKAVGTPAEPKPATPNPVVIAIQSAITTVQKNLKTLGFDPNGADGIWGPDTSAAYAKARTVNHF
jgi:hypothetical protein